mmetsp:Transcript_12555/g.31890  ORF Transcript_12555/g.31890 Transcript_12555/m.31890 type:complete len:344 (+) Transcript_12555:697-1728(+)
MFVMRRSLSLEQEDISRSVRYGCEEVHESRDDSCTLSRQRRRWRDVSCRHCRPIHPNARGSKGTSLKCRTLNCSSDGKHSFNSVDAMWQHSDKSSVCRAVFCCNSRATSESRTVRRPMRSVCKRVREYVARCARTSPVTPLLHEMSKLSSSSKQAPLSSSAAMPSFVTLVNFLSTSSHRGVAHMSLAMNDMPSSVTALQFSMRSRFSVAMAQGGRACTGRDCFFQLGRAFSACEYSACTVAYVRPCSRFVIVACLRLSASYRVSHPQTPASATFVILGSVFRHSAVSCRAVMLSKPSSETLVQSSMRSSSSRVITRRFSKPLSVRRGRLFNTSEVNCCADSAK